MNKPIPNLWMHVYAQPAWHDDACIAGTREALVQLRNAIERTLATGKETYSSAIVSDGEGYHILIQIKTFDELEKEPLPYYEPFASGRGKYE